MAHNDIKCSWKLAIRMSTKTWTIILRAHKINWKHTPLSPDDQQWNNDCPLSTCFYFIFLYFHSNCVFLVWTFSSRNNLGNDNTNAKIASFEKSMRKPQCNDYSILKCSFSSLLHYKKLALDIYRYRKCMPLEELSWCTRLNSESK